MKLHFDRKDGMRVGANIRVRLEGRTIGRITFTELRRWEITSQSEKASVGFLDQAVIKATALYPRG